MHGLFFKIEATNTRIIFPISAGDEDNSCTQITRIAHIVFVNEGFASSETLGILIAHKNLPDLCRGGKSMNYSQCDL